MKIKTNNPSFKKGNLSFKLLLLIGIPVIIFILVLVWLAKKDNSKTVDNGNGSSPQQSNQQADNGVPLPNDLKIPLVQNGKTLRSEKTESGKQEIMFYSYATSDAIIKFYKEWASYNKFELFLNEQENKLERINFSLIPNFGTTGLPDYFFVIEPKENGTRVILSYSDPSNLKTPADSETKKSEETNAEKIVIPEDFKIKF